MNQNNIIGVRQTKLFSKLRINILAGLAIIMLASCGSDEPAVSESTEELKQELQATGASEEVQEYFAALAEVVDAYVGMIEDMAEASKNSDPGSLGGAINMLGGVASGVAEMAPLLERMEELEQQGEVLKEDMSPEEVEAFMVMYGDIMQRFVEAAEKMEE
ncbi:MAG: hypothetical protein O2818_07115 [Bacteroidetes bacterium]|nr:hypothetical protein [Bacteroidota bacterium]MDA1336641.1 hypothetical protein [Bacteroidota bacterium]